ncbi:hypothetical protein NDU88_002220 [Pleurodeles waltl]|uniref:Uncharacterized protein n=1 Tax=Pleurodeles waltl TaxID=8319 RepID=A0AAV7UX02_PLEWA|nr:hypothetical protein NDU88_002220 [Pleurodeles waltl]
MVKLCLLPVHQDARSVTIKDHPGGVKENGEKARPHNPKEDDRRPGPGGSRYQEAVRTGVTQAYVALSPRV